MHAGNQQMFCVHFMEEYRYKSQRGGVVRFACQLVSLLLDRDNATDEISQGKVLGRSGREGHCLLHIAVWETFLWMQ